MNQEDIRAMARRLVFVMESGATPATLQATTQELIEALGGTAQAAQLSTGTAAFYLVALLLSHLDSRGG